MSIPGGSANEFLSNIQILSYHRYRKLRNSSVRPLLSQYLKKALHSKKENYISIINVVSKVFNKTAGNKYKDT